MEQKIVINAENLKRLTIKAYYNDLNEWRAVYNRDCQIRGKIHDAMESLYDAMDDYEEVYDPNIDNMSAGDWLFYTVVGLVKKLEEEGLVKRD